MTRRAFESLILAALDANRVDLSELTRAQYASQLRDFYDSLNRRSPKGFTTEQLDRYVRRMVSAWARRRAVSALGVLYRHLGLAHVADPLAGRHGRPKRDKVHSIALHLRSLGWRDSAITAVRWRDLLTALILRSRTCAIGRRSYALDERARTQLRALACQRYPSAARLLGRGPAGAHVFARSDLQEEV
jgi:hypothetical protein